MRLSTRPKRTFVPELTQSLCADWTKWMVARDPLMKENMRALLSRWAAKHGMTAQQAEDAFVAEEKMYLKAKKEGANHGPQPDPSD